MTQPLLPRLRVAISNAYYDARNTGRTMEQAADVAAADCEEVVKAWLDENAAEGRGLMAEGDDLSAFYCTGCGHPRGYHDAERGCTMPLDHLGLPVMRTDATVGACGCVVSPPAKGPTMPEPQTEKDHIKKVLTRHRWMPGDGTGVGFCGGPYCATGLVSFDAYAEHVAEMLAYSPEGSAS